MGPRLAVPLITDGPLKDTVAFPSYSDAAIRHSDYLSLHHVIAISGCNYIIALTSTSGLTKYLPCPA